MASGARTNLRGWIAALLFCLGPSLDAGASAGAVSILDNTVQDARVRELAESFRCLVCQNQTLADSNAGLAADLRERIREQVRQGATDAQIQTYMVSRYGDFVLYRPPLRPLTWALWFGPFVMLAAGGLVWLRSIRRRRGLVARPLDAAERGRLEALLTTHTEGPTQ